MKVGMIGAGKLGLPVALAIESKGHEVKINDISPLPGKYLKKREIPYKEEGIHFLLNKTKVEQVELEELVKWADLLFLAIQTPHEPEYDGTQRIPEERKDFDYTYLKQAIKKVSTIAEEMKKQTTLAVISTCLPGTYEREIRPLLSDHISYVYTPQFIAMGTVLQDYFNPEFNLIGVEGEEAADKLVLFYRSINYARSLKTDITTAEAIKVSYNTFISMKTVLGNTWGELCHKVGANFDDVHKAWSLSYKRLMSPRYLRSGMGDGGGCFPAGELVMTRNGMRPIESIQPGDKVLTDDGSFQNVVKLWERNYEGDLVVVKTRGLPRVRMTVEHPVLVRKDGRPRVPDGRRNTYHKIIDKLHPVKELRADHLTLDNLVGWPKIGVGEHIKFDLDFLKLAGWYLSEGSAELNARRGRLRFDLHKREARDAQDIERWLLRYASPRKNGRGANAKVTHKVEGNKRSVRFGNMGLARELVMRFGKGAQDKFIPPEVLWGTEEEARAILWGLIRGDGHRGKNGISYSTISEQLAWGVFVLLHRLGLNPTLRDIPPRGMHKRAFEVRVMNRRLASKLCRIVGWEPYEYDKEIQTYADDGETVWRHIQGLEREHYRGRVYNLWVENNHTYVVGCGAVHNCHPRDNIALSYIAKREGLSHDIFEDIIKAREDHAEWLASFLPDDVVIFGRAFKPETNIETGSPAILVANILKEQGKRFVHKEYPDPGQVNFIATQHEIYKDIKWPKGSVVIDPFGYIEDQPDVEVIRLGRR